MIELTVGTRTSSAAPRFMALLRTLVPHCPVSSSCVPMLLNSTLHVRHTRYQCGVYYMAWRVYYLSAPQITSAILHQTIAHASAMVCPPHAVLGLTAVVPSSPTL